MRAGWGHGLKRIGVLALLVGAGATHAQTGPEPAVNAAEKPAVVAVRIVTEEGKVLSENPTGITIEAGKPLEKSEVAGSLRVLFRTGKYADLRAEVTRVEGGSRLDFVVRENLFFNQVTIQGLVEPPSDASAIAAMQLGLGQTYRREIVDEALGRLREVLHDDGLYQAEVSAETVPHAETHQMDVIVHVKPGPRARVGAIQLNNETEFLDAEILKRSKIKTGLKVTLAHMQRGTDRIRKYLVKKEHLSARTVIRRGEYDSATNTIALSLDVSEGPRVQLAVTGAKISGGTLKRLVPVYQEGAVDADLLEEGKRNLREHLERQGYFDATVDYTTENHETKRNEKGLVSSDEVITYQVKLGIRHKLTAIRIEGNRYFSTELLRGRLQIFGGAVGSRGRFSRRLVDTDAQAMKGLYLSNGFLDAKVEAQVEDDAEGKEGNLVVNFKVQEGKQTRVATMAIEGNHAFKDEELLGVIGSTPGQPYSEFNVATDRDNILALYFNEGFPDASFSSTAESVPAAEGTGKTEVASKENNPEEPKSGKVKKVKIEFPQAEPVRLVYHIKEGPQTRVRKVLLAGYKRTRVRVIHREIEVKPDEPLREGEVVESQRRLYNLGVFNRVTIEPQNPNGTDTDKDIVVLVEEAKRYTIAYGGGFEVQRLASTTNPTGGQVQAAPRGIFEISKLNLTGRADSLSLKIRGSTIEDRALLGYSLPNALGNPHYSIQATAYTEKTQDINTFTEMRYEGSIQFSDQLTPRTTLLYRYTFRKVLVSDLNIFSGEIPLFQQPTLVSQFGMTWFRDTRDNPANASKGSFNSVDVSDADTIIGSSANFVRVVFQNSTYHPIKRRFSFARSVRFGILAPYRGTESLTFPAQETTPLPTLIPLPERFFGGGGTSLRGFGLNQAGPRDAISGFPVGGQALLVLNQEFRFPMRLPFVGTALGGTIFYDGGNVYSRLTRISFRSSLPRPTFVTSVNPTDPTGLPLQTCVTNCSNELNYFAHTIGFGIRYATPVGPIRVDLGYQLNRPYFVIPCTPITANTTAVPTCFKGAQLPRLQIFFNLGSSF
jgi:outer membrane protein assembly factor BamA